MPSTAKTIGLILVVFNPACLTAQTAHSNHPPPARSDTPSIGYTLPPGQSGGFRAGPTPVATPQRPQAGPFPDGRGTARTALQRAPGVVSVAYQAPPPAGVHPPALAAPGQLSGESTAGVSLAPRGRQSPLPLRPPGPSRRTGRGPTGGLPSVVTVAGSLALVLGIFFLVAWGIRRAAPAAGTALPGEVFEVLGRAPMASRQQVYLLRCGNKLILVSVTAAGAETLTEITDPAEVDRLAGLCRQAHPQSATAAFRQVLGQFTSGHPRTGFLRKDDRADLRPAAAGLPATPDGLENPDV